MVTLVNIVVGNILWWLLGTIAFGISMAVMGNMWEESNKNKAMRKEWMLWACKISALLAGIFFSAFALAIFLMVIRAALKG